MPREAVSVAYSELLFILTRVSASDWRLNLLLFKKTSRECEPDARVLHVPCFLWLEWHVRGCAEAQAPWMQTSFHLGYVSVCCFGLAGWCMRLIWRLVLPNIQFLWTLLITDSQLCCMAFWTTAFSRAWETLRIRSQDSGRLVHADWMIGFFWLALLVSSDACFGTIYLNHFELWWVWQRADGACK